MAFSTATHFLTQAQKRLTDPTFTDFVIRTAETEYKVNRALLACHSNYFQKLFESKLKEPTEGCVYLHEDDAGALAHMMTYFSTSDYGQDDTTPQEHVELYVLADKYEVPDLKALAILRLRDAAPMHYANASEALPVIKIVYDNTTSSHQDICRTAIEVWFSVTQMRDCNEEDYMQFSKDLSEVPEFATDLAMAYARTYHNMSFPPNQWEQLRQCPQYGGYGGW